MIYYRKGARLIPLKPTKGKGWQPSSFYNFRGKDIVIPLPEPDPAAYNPAYAARFQAAEPEAIDVGGFTEELPPWLHGTAEHANCPGVYLVNVLARDGSILRPMVYRGLDEMGNVLVSMPRLVGYAPGLHVIPADRIQRRAA